VLKFKGEFEKHCYLMGEAITRSSVQMFSMFLLRSRIYQDIIYEHHYKLIQVGFKNSVNQIHEEGWGGGA